MLCQQYSIIILGIKWQISKDQDERLLKLISLHQRNANLLVILVFSLFEQDVPSSSTSVSDIFFLPVENDHKATQTDAVNIDEVKRNINRLRMKITRLNRALQEKQDEITKTTEKLQLVERDPLHKELENVKKDADEGSTHAKFILDQLLNHRKRIPRWNSETIRECIILQYISPKGYSHMQCPICDEDGQNDLLISLLWNLLGHF